MLLLVGTINVFQGFVALIWDERVVATADNFIVVDLTSWGWTLLLSGLLLIAAGGGLFARQTWARITAIVIVGLHAVSQVAWLGAYPVWALLMIALDTVVLFALTVRWSAARDDLGSYGTVEGLPGDRTSGQVTEEMQGYRGRLA
jgi:hypothetical protein